LPWMSPEQVRREGHLIDGRTDIYSLGVVLYELLYSRRPFEARTKDELEAQILHREAEPPGQIRDSIPAAMERICLKALSKRITDRYTTAKDMAEELSKLIHPPWRLYRLLDIHQVGTTANTQILCNDISDELTADRLRAELRVVLETSEIKEIVLDLGNMQEASASGFRVFDFLCQQLQQRGGKPKLCNVNDSISDVLRKNRLDSLYELVPNAPRLPRPVPRRIVRHYIPEEVLSTGDRHMTVAAHRE